MSRPGRRQDDNKVSKGRCMGIPRPPEDDTGVHPTPAGAGWSWVHCRVHFITHSTQTYNAIKHVATFSTPAPMPSNRPQIFWKLPQSNCCACVLN